MQRFLIPLLLLSAITVTAQTSSAGWPASSRETKPWSRWWWHGSAVTEEGITAELEAYKKAGLGGLEITPIYGVQGKEDEFVNFLSERWVDLLLHTLREAERLDLGIDMATGTGWPFGGPWVNEDHACRTIEHKTYEMKGGQRLSEKIVFIQAPYLRTVNNQVYEVHDTTITGVAPIGSLKEPLLAAKSPITIDKLIQPVEANKNLQVLALDQVKFERPLPLQKLVAYGADGQVLDLLEYVKGDGVLDWVAPQGTWKLYAIFAGWHGKMVERAGPGGEGNVIDHFSKPALANYLKKFDDALRIEDIQTLRCFFNDSYEVDDARGNADWTPLLFEEFKKRRGYDLALHLPALFQNNEDALNKRILCDYRETISELVLENFTRPWANWAHSKNAKVRNQAHGSPANILDLYATVDIPEIEGVEPLRIKMASSAGNVTGKKLISAESATWLNEHFQSNLHDIKVAVDRFLLNGVNHIFYHGSTYSPLGEPWPGWLFYAAVHLNPRNSLWPHLSALNKYVERCQALLQASTPNNDILLYYPIYDRFSTPGEEMIEHFDAVGGQFEGTYFKRSADLMLERGYSFDYISERQVGNAKVSNGKIVTEGGGEYQTIVLPRCKYIPLATMQKIVALAEAGATIVLPGGFPEDVSGYQDYASRYQTFEKIVSALKTRANSQGNIAIGKGRMLIGDDIDKLLANAAIRSEPMAALGIKFLCKQTPAGTLYLVTAANDVQSKWIPVNAIGQHAKIYNPMTGEIGKAKTRMVGGKLEIFLSLRPAETIFVEVVKKDAVLPDYEFAEASATPYQISTPWLLTFHEGGPALPEKIKLTSPVLWNTLQGESYKTFSGCATYETEFRRPSGQATKWLLSIAGVEESAEITLNDKSIGVLLQSTGRLVVESSALKDTNKLEIRACNLMANRIAYMDKNNVGWKKFYNINFPARKPENRVNNLFNAAHWLPEPSGIAGPVLLVPLSN